MKLAEDCPPKHSIESSGDCAPPVAARPYAGWIPTVNGRLSFRHVGDSRHPEESIFANLDVGHDRLIVAYQKRPLSDILFPRLIRLSSGLSGDFWFALTVNSNSPVLEANRLSGTVYIFKSKADWRSLANQDVRTQIQMMNELRYSNLNNIPTLARLAFDRAAKVLQSTADIMVDFDLERNGEVYAATPRFREEALQAASSEFAGKAGHDINKWVADQAYFFLRDICHAHQHHEPFSDTILILQERNENDDLQWRKNIVFSLQYAVIRFKRDNDVRSSVRAMGILAYCNSFLCCCELTLKDRFQGFPQFNSEALLQSIHAKASEIEISGQAESNRFNAELTRSSGARAMILALVAILIATAAILIQPRISGTEKGEFPRLFSASTFAANNFFNLLYVSLVLIFVTWVYTAVRMKLVLKPLGRAVLEASYVRRAIVIPALFVSAAIVSGITIGYGWLAVDAALGTFRELFRLIVL